ncbi:MAG TPA: membrane protein insertase YidC [Nitrospirales bacterium]|nr:membrane protein insertase YidC [Nitrospirales bacterium]
MEKRVILFLVISLTIIIFYPLLLEKLGIITPAPPVDEEFQDEEFQDGDFTFIDQDERSPVFSEEIPAMLLPEAATQFQNTLVLEQDVMVNTDLYRAVFSSAGGVLTSWTLRRHLNTDVKDPQPIELIADPEVSYPSPLAILTEASEPNHAFSTVVYTVEGGDLELSEFEPTGNLTFWYQDPQTGVSIAKRMTFANDSYVVDIEIETSGLSDPYIVTLGTNFGVTEWNAQSFIGINGPATFINGEINKDSPEAEETREGLIGWVALQDKYFISALIPDLSEEGIPAEGKVKVFPRDEKLFSAGVVVNPLQGPQTASYQLYAGPKSYNGLRDLHVGLEDTIDFGWFIYGSWALVRAVALPLFSVLSFLYDYTHNYGLAIIILTIGVKILFAPLTYKAYVSMKAMSKLQPKMMEIQKKYKDDKQKMNIEVMNLYKNEKVNPVGGCLPILLQMPVFISLFNILYMTVELRQAPFMLWITDLSSPDPFFVLPVLMGVSMFIQQKIQPTPMDPRHAKIMLMLPFFLTFIFLNFASGLVLYWVVNNVLTIAQQYATERILGPRTTPNATDTASKSPSASSGDTEPSKKSSKKSKKQGKRSQDSK